MNNCPQCNRATLIEKIDDLSGFKYRVCVYCAYYESDSEAYRIAPYLFKDLGHRILAEMQKEAKKYGLSDIEVQGWLENESNTFAKDSTASHARFQPMKVNTSPNPTLPPTTQQQFKTPRDATVPI